MSAAHSFTERVRGRRMMYLATTPGVAVTAQSRRIDLASGDLVLLGRGDDHELWGTGETNGCAENSIPTALPRTVSFPSCPP
ncbi:hypothetical protein [Gordonia sp. PP30]|uniref:hypothetical protein n=1 Tax=Gordonia sp. PP30 TaxID=2935861 RepID=UPI0024B574E0|nr:hypothetical protein [Gordonia sp. PP30]